MYEEQLKATRLLSGNCIDSFFSRLKLDLSSQTENVVACVYVVQNTIMFFCISDLDCE